MNDFRGDYAALVLDEAVPDDAELLELLRQDPAVLFVDRLELQRTNLRSSYRPPGRR